MKSLNNTLRGWLIENEYLDVARIIDEIMDEWRENGNKQRRNWWDILAGDKKGQSRIVAGREIPVLRAAQKRKGVNVTKNAIQRNKNEDPPLPSKINNRWNRINP